MQNDESIYLMQYNEYTKVFTITTDFILLIKN